VDKISTSGLIPLEKEPSFPREISEFYVRK